MKSRHVLDLLPLWVEGDLSHLDQQRVDGHLETCAACAAEAQALRRSQAWLKEAAPAPFEAADFAALRSAVLAQVASEPLPQPPPARSLPLRPLLAAAALLLLVLGAPRIPSWLAPAPILAPATPEAPALREVALTLPEPPALPRPLPRHRPSPLRAGPALRLEFQTADPAIRVIWLPPAAPSPASETTPRS